MRKGREAMTETSVKSPYLINREECMLVIIDVQERLIPVMAHRERITENIKKLAKFSSIIGLPAILTEQEKLGSTIMEIKTLFPEANPISKVHFNCFYCQEFDESIKKINRSTLILAGIEAHICVAQTALHALPSFNVHVVADAISSRTSENWSISIERMRQKGAIITSTEMLIYELLQKAGTEEFKSALQLVK